MKKKEKIERNRSIKSAITHGKPVRDVGKTYGISGKRAWDIANRKAKKKKRKTRSK